MNHSSDARQADAVVGAVAGHGGHEAGALDLLGPQGQRLGPGHGQVEEEQVVAGQEPAQLGPAGGSRPMSWGRRVRTTGWWWPGCACGGRRPSAGPGRRRPKTSIGPDAAEALGQQRPGDLAQEHQPLDRGRRLPAEPRHLAGALVDGREGPGAALVVVDHEHRHRRADGAGHGDDGGVQVGRLQLGPRRPPAAPRPPAGSSAQPSAITAARTDRRSGSHSRSQAMAGAAVDDGALLHAGQRGAGGSIPTSTGAPWSSRRATSALASSMAAGVPPVQAAEGGHQPGVAVGREAPVDVDHRPALVPDGVGEQGEAEVDHLHLRGQLDDCHDGPVGPCRQEGLLGAVEARTATCRPRPAASAGAGPARLDHGLDGGRGGAALGRAGDHDQAGVEHRREVVAGQAEGPALQLDRGVVEHLAGDVDAPQALARSPPAPCGRRSGRRCGSRCGTR